MDKKKEMNRLLKGIEEEIENLEKNKDSIDDYGNRVAELKKEAEKIKQEIS